VRKLFILFKVIIIFTLLFGSLGASSPPANMAAQRVHPMLLQAAQRDPQQTLRVIVQRQRQRDGLETMLASLGGRVVQDFHIIDALVAELPAHAVLKLASDPGVHFISPDGAMERSGFTSLTVADTFPSASYSNNTGTANWQGAWVEGGESDGVTAGFLRVGSNSRCASGTCLAFGGSSANVANRSLTRSANLAGVQSAVLSFSYRRYRSASNYGSVSLQISGDGGASWVTLANYPLTASDSAQVVQNFNLSGMASANTLLRFQGAGTMAGFIYFDNIQITYLLPTTVNYFLGTTGADKVHFQGLSGEGITVAVVDSGVAPMLDFDGRLTLPADYPGTDDFGHGTHVAGIIGSNGSTVQAYKGIAPGVDLISLDVTDNTGMTYESTVIGALQWIYDHKDQLNIKVVNLSLNSTLEISYHQSPLDAACEILWFNRVVVVASAGNKGPAGGFNTINTAPANDPFIITVGASDEKGNANPADDTVAPFSSFGVTWDGFTKPDIIAPGYNVVQLLSPYSNWALEHPDRVVENAFIRLSGTSMAAPMVSAAVALLLQDEPNLTPDQVKYRLLNSDRMIAGDGFIYPYLDVYAAVQGTSTESANTGLTASQMLTTGSDPITWNSVGWNSVGWNSVGWNSVGWNSVGWNSVGWNSLVEVDGVFWGKDKGKNK